MHRQFDIPLTTQYHFIIPSDVDGRLTQEDFIYFAPDSTVSSNDFEVVVESYSGNFLKVGELAPIVKLPHVHFSYESLVMLLPRNGKESTRFIGTLVRGHKYIVSKKNNRVSNNLYLMK